MYLTISVITITVNPKYSLLFFRIIPDLLPFIDGKIYMAKIWLPS